MGGRIEKMNSEGTVAVGISDRNLFMVNYCSLFISYDVFASNRVSWVELVHFLLFI